MSIEERMEFVLRSIESHDRQIGDLVDGLAQTKAQIDTLAVRIDSLASSVETLVKVSNRDGVDILNLARIAENRS